ncbi:MAG: CarD family transcriptional regulator, partial [Lachnospiraceae bacterium]|nr:CarD family transcriptional regulator [Lachnospiraceae bacterium]
MQMYQIGELVQYGTSGVCRIEEIVQGVPWLQKDTECYLLVPVSKKEEKIYTPVD